MILNKLHKVLATGDIKGFFVLKCSMLRSQSLSGNNGVLRTLNLLPPPFKHTNVEVELQSVSYTIQTQNTFHHNFVSAPVVSIFNSQFQPADTFYQVRYIVSCTKNKYWKIVTCKVDFMKI